jgi:hypothetical protein
MNLSPQQMKRALALIKAIDADQRAVENLGRLIAAAEITAEANHRARSALTDYLGNPDALGDAIALCRRADPEIKRMAQARYQILLANMIAPLLGGPPRKIDFNALKPAARPALLMPYLDLDVGNVFPHLCFERSDPATGRLVYVVTSGVIDRERIALALPAASAWLGDNWRLAETTATTFTLERRPELPREIAFNPAWLKPGHLMLGIDVETQRPFRVPLARMTHTLIAGTPGMGKSVFLHLLLRSCLSSIDQFQHIYAVCGQGVAFERYRGLHPKLTVDNEPEHLATLITDLQVTMKERTARLVAEKRDKMGEYILVLIDEWGAFNTPEGGDRKAKEAHAAFLHAVMHLGKRGRKVGIRLMLVVQEPVERDIATGIRSTLPSIVSFRLPLAAHGQSLFGEFTPPAVPADIRTLPIGRAVHHDGETSRRTLIQVPMIKPPERRP